MNKLRILIYSYIILSLLFINSANAQQLQFPDSNATWEIQFVNDLIFQGYISYDLTNQFYSLNSKTYTKLLREGMAYGGLHRDTSRKIWHNPEGTQDEHLLFDFNATFGDSILVYSGLWADSEIVYIGSTATWNINGVNHDFISLTSNGQWIVGVSGYDGLFENDYIGNLSGIQHTLHCFTVNDTVVYDKFNTCFTGIESFNSEVKIEIIPNPSFGDISILLPNSNPGIYELAISNTLGQIVYSNSDLISSLVTINLTNLPPGLYYVQIQSSNTSSSAILVLN